MKSGPQLSKVNFPYRKQRKFAWSLKMILYIFCRNFHVLKKIVTIVLSANQERPFLPDCETSGLYDGNIICAG